MMDPVNAPLPGPQGPLHGVRVLDVAPGFLAYTGRVLSDLGADVVRVELLGGDSFRTEQPLLDGQSLAWWDANLGKRSIVLAEDDPRLADLLKVADLALVGDHVSFEAPDTLIVAALRPFGEGPKAAWPVTDAVLQAASGLVGVTGLPDLPMVVPGPQAHLLGAQYLASGVMLALRQRRLTGRGGVVDVSLQEAVISAIEHLSFRYLFDGHVTERTGSFHWVRGYNTFQCTDGFATLSWNRNFDHLVALLSADDAEQDLADPRFEDPAARDAEIQHIQDVMADWARTRTRAETFEKGQLFRLPWASIQQPAEVVYDPQLTERDFFQWLPGPGGPLPATSGMAQLSVTPWKPRNNAAVPGEHTDDVLREWLAASEPTMVAPTTIAFRPTTIRLPQQFSSHNPLSVPAPLAGIRVLDLTWVLAGPFGTRLLADYGADVIKVQTDRKLTGYVADGYFSTWNRSKRGITIDLSTDKGKELLHRLVPLCDVVVDNFSARVMGQWGLSDAALRAIRPDIVIAHLTGMGHNGLYEHYVSYGPTAQSLSGFTALINHQGRPTGFNFSYSDHIAGIGLATGILAALEHRDRTGQGQVVDCSQFEATAAMLGLEYLKAYTGATSASRARVVQCGDGRWLVAEGDDATINGVAHLTAETAAEVLCAQGIPAHVVMDAADLIDRDLHLRPRGFWTSAQHPVIGETRFHAPVARIAGTPVPRPSPTLGQHNEEVFGGLLGLSIDEIRELGTAGVLK